MTSLCFSKLRITDEREQTKHWNMYIINIMQDYVGNLLDKETMAQKQEEQEDQIEEPSNLIHFTGTREQLLETIHQNITKYSVFMVDFFATWCGPCRRLGKLLPEIASANPKALFFKVNIEENRELSASFSVKVLPTIVFLIYHDGQIKLADVLQGFQYKAICNTIAHYVKTTYPYVQVYNCHFTYENPNITEEA